MTNHAILSPSGFKALMLCPAKPAMERGLPDESSEFADEGTAAHFLGSECLTNGYPAAHYLGAVICVAHSGTEWSPIANPPEGRTFEVDPEMAEAVQVYIDLVHDRMEMHRKAGATSVELFVEQALPIGHITGEEGAEGTGDAVIVAVYPNRTVVDVIDLKYGKGVEVSAEDNPQLRLYALGAIEKFGMVYDFTEANMIICQPRISQVPSEESLPVDELVAWGELAAKPAATLAYHYISHPGGLDYITHGCRPHPEACRFCKAKGTCPALAKSVEQALEAEFTDLTTADQVEKEQIVKGLTGGLSVDQLGAKMDAVELVEMWCKAIRARVESELIAGKPVAGYKLVQGKKGNRAWADAVEAEKTMKSMRLKKGQMYEFKVISPTTAEKLLKATPKRWARVAPLITQADGKPSVAPISDKRPALEVKPVESEFTAITDGVGDLV